MFTFMICSSYHVIMNIKLVLVQVLDCLLVCHLTEPGRSNGGWVLTHVADGPWHGVTAGHWQSCRTEKNYAADSGHSG